MPHLSELLANTKTETQQNAIHAPSKPQMITRKLFDLFCKTLFRTYCPLNVSGLTYLPNAQFILCSNHCSHMDTAALIYATKMPLQRFSILAAQDYFFENPRKTHLSAYLLNLVPISRKITRKSLTECINLCLAHKKLGRNIIIYPEGTRSTNGQIQDFKNGAALIAEALDLPILPAYIKGTYRAMAKGSNFIKPNKIHVTFGPAIRMKALKHHNDNNIYSMITNKLKDTIMRLKENNLA